MKRKRKTRHRAPAPIAAIAAAAVCLALSLWEPGGRLALLALCAVQLAPLVGCWRRKRIDFLAIILAGQFVGYSCTNLAQCVWHGFLTPLPYETALAMKTLLVCTLLTALAFYGVREWKPLHADCRKHRLLKLKPVQLAALAVALGLSYYWVGESEGVGKVFLLNTQFLICALIFCAEVPHRPLAHRAVEALAIVGVLYTYLGETNLGFAINLVVIWLMKTVLDQSRKSLVQGLALLLFMVPLQWVKGDFRYVVLQHPDYTVATRAKVLAELLREKVAGGARTALTLPAPVRSLATRDPQFVIESSKAGREAYLAAEALKSAIDRVRDDTLDRVLQWTPDRVRFWRGQSYLSVFYLTIPEALWPSKPDWNLWNDFGKKYRILSPVDEVTEVVFSSYVEAYMNFGYAWLFAFSALLGLGIAMLQKLSTLGRTQGLSFAFICFLMPFLSYQEDLGSSLSKLLFTSLLILPAAWYLRRSPSPKKA